MEFCTCHEKATRKYTKPYFWTTKTSSNVELSISTASNICSNFRHCAFLVTIVDVKEKYVELHINDYRNLERVKRIIRMADDAADTKLTGHSGNIRTSWLTIEIQNILFGRNCTVKPAPPNRDGKRMREWEKEFNELWEKTMTALHTTLHEMV